MNKFFFYFFDGKDDFGIKFKNATYLAVELANSGG